MGDIFSSIFRGEREGELNREIIYIYGIYLASNLNEIQTRPSQTQR